MKAKFITQWVLILFLISLLACSKDNTDSTSKPNGCSTSARYTEVKYETKMTTVTYGSNFNTNGTPIELKMDVYEPINDDNDKRPVIIWAFGGAFISGSRADMRGLAEQYAKKGYVAATIDYRLLQSFFPIDSTIVLDIAIKAASDMKAAVRHFRKDAATVNQFKVDPELIMVGGISAGAITALQAGIFRSNNTTDPYINSFLANNGGIEGNSGDAENLKYSSKVKAIINFSGAIYRLNFLDADDPEILSFHGDNDEVVPYDRGVATVFGIPLIPLFGSKAIDTHAPNVPLKHTLYTVSGGDHSMIYTSANYATDRANFERIADKRLREIICGN